MTDEILDRAEELKCNIKHMTEILDVLNADRLDISITSHVNGITYRHEWQGDSDMGVALKYVMINAVKEKLGRYVTEFEAL